MRTWSTWWAATTGGRTLAVFVSSTERPTGKSPVRSEVLSATFVGLASLAVYVLTLAPTVATNDAGRFQISAPLLGTGHPTGYPTFILFGKLFTFLPLGDVAYRVSLMAAVFGAGAAVLAYLVARSIGARQTPAVGAALIFAFSTTFWSQATLGEVYTMHAFFVLLVTLLLLRWREEGGMISLLSAAFVFGVSLGNNAGMVLFAPMFVILFFTKGKRRVTVRRTLAGGIVFLGGLSVYAYIPLRGFAGAWHNYGDPVNNWSEVWAVISGSRFQGLMDPTPGTVLGNVGGFLAQFSAQAPAPFGYGLLALLLVGGLGGAAALFARDKAVAMAIFAGLLAALVYALSYEIDDIAVYYIPVYMILCLLLAVGITEAGNRMAVLQPLFLAPVIVAALVLGLNFAPSDRSDYYDERARSEDILETLPEGAILYGKVEIIPVTYLVEVEDERPDVTLRWLDGGTLKENFERDLTSERPVYFISHESCDDDYLPATEEFAASEEEGDLIYFEPR
ncbi:MAG: glycosyltransferase family 117 protein [Rubrobacter sp.]